MRTTIPGHEASSERNGKGAGLKKESRQRCRIQEKWIPEGVYMGLYLNSFSPYTLYKNETCSPYFVDKSMLLEELFPLAELGNRHICITRPRRWICCISDTAALAISRKRRLLSQERGFVSGMTVIIQNPVTGCIIPVL